MVWTDLKGVTDSNAIILGDSNTSVTSMDRTVQLSHSVVSNSLQPHGQNSQTKLIKQHIRQDGLRFTYNIPSKCSRIHILFKYTWNIFQDRSYDVTKQVSVNSRDWNYIVHLFDHNGMKLEINYKQKTGKNTNT